MSELANADHRERRRRGRRRRVPYVQQLEGADCGAACLAMVLSYWGHDESLRSVRDVLAVSGAGLTAKAIMDGAKQFGLDCRGVKLEIEGIRHLPPASIIHWSFGHWVVFERVEARGVRIVDPASGRRLIPMETFRRKFTGVALLLRPNAHFVRRTEKRSRTWPYIKRLFGDRRLLTQVLLMTVLVQAFAMALPAVIGLVVDRVVPRSDYSMLIVLAAASGMVIVFQLLSSLFRMLLLVGLRTKLDFELATSFMGHLVSLPYAFFQTRRTGDLMMRVNSNSRIREFLASTVISGILDATLTILSLAVILALSPWMALLVVCLGAARVGVLVGSHRQLTESMAAQLDASARAQAYLAEMVAGVQTLKAGGQEHQAIDRWTNLYTEELDEAARRGRLEGISAALLETLEIASPLAVIGVGALLALSGHLSLGMMLALVALATSFLRPLTQLVDSGIQLSLLRAYLERVEDVFQTEPEQPPGRRPPTPRLRGGITLRNVSFRYGRDQPLVIDDVSLDILPGQTVAIVGSSGAGKTTLANLLLALYLPTEGEIRFDGTDVRDLDLPSLRRQIGVVSQHPYLFSGTVRDNITMNDDTVPLSRCIRAARSAKLHGDVMKLPMGYQSLLPDRAESLSGGQRQRLALARSLLRRPAILLLDEATSALDARTEQEIARSVERLHCTRIVIAHRLSTIASADLIVVLHGGRIVETGTHEELLTHGQMYRSLIEAQTSLSVVSA